MKISDVKNTQSKKTRNRVFFSSFLFWGWYFLGQLFTWWVGFRALLPIYFFVLLIIGYWNVSNFFALSKKESGLFMINLLLLSLLIVGNLSAYVLMVYRDISYFLSWVLDRAFFKALYNNGTYKSQDCFFEALFVVLYLLGGIVAFWVSFLMVDFQSKSTILNYNFSKLSFSWF